MATLGCVEEIDAALDVDHGRGMVEVSEARRVAGLDREQRRCPDAAGGLQFPLRVTARIDVEFAPAAAPGMFGQRIEGGLGAAVNVDEARETSPGRHSPSGSAAGTRGVQTPKSCNRQRRTCEQVARHRHPPQPSTGCGDPGRAARRRRAHRLGPDPRLLAIDQPLDVGAMLDDQEHAHHRSDTANRRILKPERRQRHGQARNQRRERGIAREQGNGQPDPAKAPGPPATQAPISTPM